MLHRKSFILYHENQSCAAQMQRFGVQPSGTCATHKGLNSYSTVVTIYTNTIYMQKFWIPLPQIVCKCSVWFANQSSRERRVFGMKEEHIYKNRHLASNGHVEVLLF
jgi:hypothetical protein